MFRTVSLTLALALGITSSAHAQDPMGEPPEAMPGDPAAEPMVETPVVGDDSTYVGRGIQNRAGQLRVDAFVFANMSADDVFKPFSISPNVYFGVTDQLQVGLVHTTPLFWQTPGDAGTSLCLAGEENGCGKVYNNVGLDVLFGFMQGPTDLAAHATLYANPIDPFALAVSLGVKGKVRFSEMLALAFDPQILIGLTERDPNNKEQLYVPVELQAQLIPPLALALQTAIWGPFDGFGDSYAIPVGLAAIYTVNPMVDVGLRFAFDNLLGKVSAGVGRGDFRTLSLLVSLRF